MLGGRRMAGARDAARAWKTMALAVAIGCAFGARESTATAADGPPRVDKPMAGEMKKPGMMQGDVKKAADQWDRKMKDMMQKEKAAAPPTGAKK